MRRILGTLLLSLLAMASLTAPALAASPHFIGTPTITKNANGSLTASFKAAGLGNLATDVFLSSTGGTAVLQCLNPGGNDPPPKLVSFGPLESHVVTVDPRNGQVT